MTDPGDKKLEMLRPAITAVENAQSTVADLAVAMAKNGCPDEDVSVIIELVHGLQVAGLALRSYIDPPDKQL